MAGSGFMKSTCGVVGYHVRFTRERPPVRTRAVAFFCFWHPPLCLPTPSQTPNSHRNRAVQAISKHIISFILFFPQKCVVETDAAGQPAARFPVEKQNDKFIQLLVRLIGLVEYESTVHVLSYFCFHIRIFIHFLFLV